MSDEPRDMLHVCPGRLPMHELEDANAAALAARSATETVHASELLQHAEDLRLKQTQNTTSLIASMNSAKERAVADAQEDMNTALSAARDAGATAVHAMMSSLDTAEAKAHANEALEFEATKHEYADKIRQAAADRDEAVSKAQGERDDVLKELHGLQVEANDVRAAARQAARARTEAEQNLAEYKQEAEAQLNKARNDIIEATTAAESVTKSVRDMVSTQTTPGGTMPSLGETSSHKHPKSVKKVHANTLETPAIAIAQKELANVVDN